MHVDIDPAEIGKNVDAARADRGRRPARPGRDRRGLRADADPGRLAEWWARIDGWRATHPPRAPRTRTRSTEAAFDELQAAIGDAVVTTDVGQHQMWAADRLRFDRPRRWITSGGLGTMGFGLPAAIGAQIACPDATVVCVTGEARS